MIHSALCHLTAPNEQEVATVAVASWDWPEVQPLTAKIEAHPYPLEALPTSIREAVREVMNFVQAPIPLVASSALAAASVAVQARVDIERASKLTGPSSLFLLTIADSGERKSSCDGFFTKAIKDFEAEQAEVMVPVVKAHIAAFGSWEAKGAGVKNAIQSAAKAGKPTADLERDLATLEAAKPESPSVPHLIYQDAGPEALRYGLAHRWPSGAVLSNEAGVVFGSHGMNAESLMRNLSNLNQLWDGTEIAIERRTSESFTVRGARLTMGLQVQEATLRAFLKTSGDLARGSGFLARFLIAWPLSNQGTRFFVEPPVNWPSLAAFQRRMTEVLSLPLNRTSAGVLCPRLLKFTPEAKNAWSAFHDCVERHLGEGHSLRDIRDVASKAADNAARLAAVFQVFQSGEGGPVNLDSFERAARIVDWHLHEARRFFCELSLPRELSDAVRLEDWLIRRFLQEGVTEISTRDALRGGPSTMRTREALNAALSTLKEMDRCRVIQDGKRRLIQIHPTLIRGAATLTVATVATHESASPTSEADCRESRNCLRRTPEGREGQDQADGLAPVVEVQL